MFSSRAACTVAGAVKDTLSQARESEEETVKQWGNLEPPKGRFPCGKLPRRPGEFVLRVAIVVVSQQGNSEAILDACDVPLGAGEPIDIHLGFDHRNRELPGIFGQYEISFEASGFFHGVDGNLGLLSIAESRLETSHTMANSHWSVSNGMLAGDFVARVDEPVARLLSPSGRAVFMVLLRSDSIPTDEAGTFAYWKSAFAAAAERPPVPDRDAIDAAVARLAPSAEHLTDARGVFETRGPWLDAATASYVLGDRGLAERVVSDLRENDELVDSIFRAGLSNSINSDEMIWESAFVLRCIGLFSYRERQARLETWIGPDRFSERPAWDLELGDYPVARVLAMTRDEDLIEMAGRHLETLCGDENYRFLWSYVLANESPNPVPAAVTAWAKSRQRVEEAIRPPLRWVVHSMTAVFLYHLLVPLVALGLALVPRGTRRRLPRLPAVLLVALVIAGLVVRPVLFPLWAVCFVRRLRHESKSPWWFRLAVFFGLTGSLYEFLYMFRLVGEIPALTVAGAVSMWFCFLAIGHVVVAQRAVEEKRMTGAVQIGIVLVSLAFVWLALA